MESANAFRWRESFYASRGMCPRCGVVMTTKGPSNIAARRSRDHILPVEWGGLDHGHIGGKDRLVVRGQVQPATRNLVTLCQRCNGRRATCLHCWGLVACVDAVAKDTGSTFRRVYRAWRIGYVRAASSASKRA